MERRGGGVVTSQCSTAEGNKVYIVSDKKYSESRFNRRPASGRESPIAALARVSNYDEERKPNTL